MEGGWRVEGGGQDPTAPPLQPPEYLWDALLQSWRTGNKNHLLILSPKSSEKSVLFTVKE